ncbi:class I SAM-dependent methyltransferase [Usitatibacter palustris]|uniref:2-methoxy-6-polyprenyl-1,4-benzoquinol methylase, mitochondrial n=1 Tax=Usitatibacter palustris TaxID=2732487 RepID=A0A6M4HEQ7_9PROT|nr:class I SAM-dependent methyltransferase [Usitatibacter palustris]QJR16497.1 2-methoxy-6-polyprenyl-1,4-benzoquinol methylase, mitochondrial [Usitatibacter palustris]
MDLATYAVEAEVERTHWWFAGRRKMLRRLITGLGIARDARILDIGTSTGTNLRMLKEMAFTRYEGLDMSDDAVRWCDSKGLGKVTRGDVCNIPFPDATFDLVLATDIIEHVDDDGRALAEIRRVLKPGASVIITVPAFQFLWGLQDDVAHHKRRYRGGQVDAVIAGAGLQRRASFYFNFILLAPIYAARQVIRLMRIPLRSENEVNGPFVNRLLNWIFGFDVAVAPWLHVPFGVSYLAVAVREPGAETRVD